MKVRVRMGIHTDEARIVDGNYRGIDVHRAARIAAAGHAGQILASETTRALVECSRGEPVTFTDLGGHRLKELDRPDRMYHVRVPGLISTFPPPRSSNFRRNNLTAHVSSFIGRERELRWSVPTLRSASCRRRHWPKTTSPRRSRSSAEGGPSGGRRGRQPHTLHLLPGNLRADPRRRWLPPPGHRLLGASEAVRKAAGVPRYIYLAAPNRLYDRTVAALREALGDERFESAKRQGRSMSPHQAVSYAVGGGWEQSVLAGSPFGSLELEPEKVY